MNKLNILAVLTFIFGSLSFLGCGGAPSGQPLTAQSANFILGQFNTSLNNLPRSNTVPTLPINGITASSVSTKATGCDTVTPVPTVDADNDSIAATKKYTYNCNDFVSGEVRQTYKGTVEIKDMDESVKGMFGGIRADFNVPIYNSVEIATGNTYQYSHVGFWEYKNINGSLISTSSYSGKNKYGYNGLMNDYTYTYTWNYKMTPDSSVLANVWNSGKIELSGSYELNGQFIQEVNNKKFQTSGTWVVRYTSKDLVYDTNCTKWYKSGSYFMEDSGNKMEIRYACTSAKLYVNGVESNWWTP